MKIAIKRIVIVLIFSQLLQGCGGGGDGGDSSRNASGVYEGVWYTSSEDSYLEIGSDNTVAYKECTINDGYRTTDTGAIDGSSLDLFNSILDLSVVDGDLIVSAKGADETIQFVRKASIPVVCTGDAIEITFISPTTAIEGNLTTFIVNFDYRLASADAGIVYIGFNTSNASDSILMETTFEIGKAEMGSGSLTADVAPVSYDAPDTFNIYINLSRNPHPQSWTPLANASIAVTVTSSVPRFNKSLLTKPTAIIGDKHSFQPHNQCSVFKSCSKAKK